MDDRTTGTYSLQVQDEFFFSASAPSLPSGGLSHPGDSLVKKGVWEEINNQFQIPIDVLLRKS